ncbi:ubiquinone biosynthesis protein [Georgenia soli]|uniref:Ubiquinone biosynthesis protein n=1 Tax=Georgenia soli TaxID=638953 RepID=A0A2A9ERM5_9MICO|nr:AarF/UbiB family protein [Georgenia soli]PFG40885.1 ubiquinone biosynthesis protein [Georgenia soli]
MSPLLFVVAAILYVATVALFTLAVRRLLGVQVSIVRAAVATLVALTVTRPVLDALVTEPVVSTSSVTTEQLLYVALLGAVTFVLAMVIIVVAEVLVPDGSVPGPIDLWRGWRSRLSRSGRYLEILRIAWRHGLSRFLRGRRHLALGTVAERRDLARSLRRALEDGGVTFVKLGQQLSTRHDLLPAEFVAELSHLQDQAAPIPWEEAADLVRTETGRSLDELFAEIEEQPLAAASVAQVHGARLRTGERVVVKVQRPGIEHDVERDLNILVRLASMLDARTDWGRSIGLLDLAHGFSAALTEELDFTVERDNMRGVAAALDRNGTNGIHVPKPVEELSTSRVLVMERLEGVPLTGAEQTLVRLGPETRTELASTLLRTVMDQLLDSGIFHVDLHPGNLLVADDGTLGMLDLGSVGRLGAKTRRSMGQFLASIGTGDSMAASEALLEVVERPEEIDERALEQAIGVLILRYTAGGPTDGTVAFGSLFTLINSFRLGVPPEVAAVFRAMATLDSTLRALDPGYDLVGEAKEMSRSRMARLSDPGRLKETVEQELSSLLPIVRRLPHRIDRLADAAEHGRLTANVRLFADQRDRRIVTNLVHRTLLTVLAATTGLMSVVLYTVNGGPMVTDEASIYTVLATCLFVVSVVLGLRVLIIIFRREEP